VKKNRNKNIYIKGAKLHNLKNIDVEIPRNKLTVITGLSGSGKSSLAFDTLYAEGQRKYVESLSSYARQFLGKLDKPKVDYISGISPAIAIEQKVNTTNPRSTVGTSTEIYDYLKLLYARIGVTYSPISNNKVKKDTVTDILSFIKKLNINQKLLLLSPIKCKNKSDFDEKLDLLKNQGYSRIKYNNVVDKIDNFNHIDFNEFYLVVDRIITVNDESFYNRLADAIEVSIFEGNGVCVIEDLDNNKLHEFNTRFELDGQVFLEPSTNLFSFNNPYGACPKCEGYGDIVGIDKNLVIKNKELSVYEDAILPWKGQKLSKYKNDFIKHSHKFNFPIHKPYHELSENQKNLLFDGNEYFKGINAFFNKIESKSYKIQNRVLLSRYRGKTLCTQCKGNRLREESNFVKVNNKSISELINLSIKELLLFFNKIKLTDSEKQISKRILIEIKARLGHLSNVGLDYLTLNRKSKSLSGGESQRINIATSLGSSLVGSLYILDEPSIGLHSNDTIKLIKVLKSLRDLGNTVIVVEHDHDIMKQADHIIDIGPKAGSEGGELVAFGNYTKFLKQDSITAKYLNRKIEISVPKFRRNSKDFIKIIGARENNLKNINVNIPLGVITTITGVSGCGKSSLVKNILYPALQNELGIFENKRGEFTKIDGDLVKIDFVEFINQNPIGRSSRSNPVTYIKAYDDIRNLFSNHNLSRQRMYKPKHFSFNVDGGRCDKCKGDGEITIEMQFMADVHLVCDQCKGSRFKKEILDVKYSNKNIFDILNMTINEALSFFESNEEIKIYKKLLSLKEVGLGYVKLGQSSSTLSGGEAQRIKLAYFLGKANSNKKGVFIFDEPTTGLHTDDIKKLLTSFNALIDIGNTIIIVEHNLELIKCSDYIIDLGPVGGKKGGYIIAEGSPEDLIKNKKSLTAKYLKEYLK
jgi:excinuclease ABC subunit A